MLETGSNALDWAGLPLAVACFGITDVDGLIHRLLVIKHHNHRKPE